jgi:hypothetical protein
LHLNERRKEREREEWKLREEDSLPPPKKNEREKHTDTGRQFDRPVGAIDHQLHA